MSSDSTVRKASTTRGVKPSPITTPSMSRLDRCLAAASMLSAPTTAMRSPSATDSAGYDAAAAQQQHSGVIERVAVGQAGLIGFFSSIRRSTVACRVRTRSAARSRATRRSTLSIWAEGNGVVRQRIARFERDQRQIGPSRRDGAGQACDLGCARARHDRNYGRRLHLGHTAGASAQSVSTEENDCAASRAAARDGRPAFETTRSGPC